MALLPGRSRLYLSSRFCSRGASPVFTSSGSSMPKSSDRLTCSAPQTAGIRLMSGLERPVSQLLIVLGLMPILFPSSFCSIPASSLKYRILSQMTGIGGGLTGIPVFMSMTELVRETDLSIFLRGIGVSFLSSAAVPYVRAADSLSVLLVVLLLRIAGIRFILPYNIKIHVHNKITIYKHNNT